MYKNDENRWLGITDHLVIDVIDTFVLDFGYDKKTVEKIFYKKHKLNDFDDLTSKEVIEIEDEVKNALGITESKKSARKSIKEAKNDFNLYELQNYYPFKKEWENAIKSEGFKIHEVSGDKIVFAINTDEGKFYNKLINAEIIIEDNMPIFLAKLLSWLKLDFGCSWTFGDEDEVDGYQYIDFMIW